LNVQKPPARRKPAWWKPEHGAHAKPREARAVRAAESIAPVVQGSDRATSGERLPKPLSRRRASTSRTKPASCASAIVSASTGVGASTRIGRPRSSQRRTTAPGFEALGE
jgi:hypothetical protein